MNSRESASCQGLAKGGCIACGTIIPRDGPGGRFDTPLEALQALDNGWGAELGQAKTRVPLCASLCTLNTLGEIKPRYHCAERT